MPLGSWPPDRTVTAAPPEGRSPIRLMDGEAPLQPPASGERHLWPSPPLDAWLLGDNLAVAITNQPQNFPLVDRSTWAPRPSLGATR